MNERFESLRPLALIIVIGAGIVGVSLIVGITLNYDNNNPYNNDYTDPGGDCSSYMEVDASGTGIYIVDGDTLDVSGLTRIRLADINTPESGEPGYQEAKDKLYNLTYGRTVYVDIDDFGSTSYGRIICVIYVYTSDMGYINVNKYLWEYGYAALTDYTNNEFNPYSWSTYYNC